MQIFENMFTVDIDDGQQVPLIDHPDQPVRVVQNRCLVDSTTLEDAPSVGNRVFLVEHRDRMAHDLGRMNQRTTLQVVGQHSPIGTDGLPLQWRRHVLDTYFIALLGYASGIAGSRQRIDTVHRLQRAAEYLACHAVDGKHSALPNIKEPAARRTARGAGDSG